MSEAIEDFWPEELPVSTDPSPVKFLKDQAALLERRTKGDLKAIVKTSTEGGRVYYSLWLKADSIGDIQCMLLSLAYPLLGQESDYPIAARGTSGVPEVKLEDDDEFREWLRAQLSSDSVKSMISQLLRYISEQRTHRVG